MVDYGPSDVSTTNLGTNQFPISEVYVPNVGLKALGGGPKQTDSSGKDYAPMLASLPAVNRDGDSTVAGLFASNSGGPALSSGLASLYHNSRLRTTTGKKTVSFSLNAPTAGDAQLTANPAISLPLYPGMAIDIIGGGLTERVEIADSFVPSSSITTIPLRSPVVHNGEATAYVDVFNPFGGILSAMVPEGILPFQLCITDSNGFLWPITNTVNNIIQPANALPAVPYIASPDFGSASQLQTNYHFAAVPSQQLSGSGIKGNALAAKTFKGCIIYINITAIGTGNVTVSLYGYDYNIGQSANYLVLASAAFNSNGLRVLKIYPGLTAVANQVANDLLPPLSYIQIDGANGTTMQVDMALVA